ncbi:hypothetical protein ASD83_16980 [Devosia sp. Root685]|nr:hypothetical protein ASD83_16980 [Devosia sp. Root685]
MVSSVSANECPDGHFDSILAVKTWKADQLDSQWTRVRATLENVSGEKIDTAIGRLFVKGSPRSAYDTVGMVIVERSLQPGEELTIEVQGTNQDYLANGDRAGLHLYVCIQSMNR